MAKSLIITEKPSVARDVVAALGGFSSREGGQYWESGEFVCTFAVGHLLELLAPEDIDPALKQWSLATLPIVPRRFKWKPVTGHEKRLALIRRLAERPDVSNFINGCDAAREGELIFRELIHWLDSRKHVRRLWLQSMTPEAIRAGFDKLRDGADLDGLGAAAECRAKTDWLIGMNATRAFSIRMPRGRDSAPWSVGRVQTPTLALLVERELAILGHQPEAYWRVKAQFGAADHDYEGVWFDPKHTKDDKKPEKKDDRLFTEERAREIAAAVDGRQGKAQETREESLRHAPLLFNLTGLQKYMSQRFKWAAKRTLDAAQRCYEQHKVLTYPRTSSSCLPSDYKVEVARLIDVFAGEKAYAGGAQYLQANGRKNDKRTFDDAGVSDHFAIIPTGALRALSGDDEKVFDAVVRRFLATFHPPAVYDKVKRWTVVAGEHFRTGPVETLRVPGWLAVYDRREERDAAPKLPPLAPGGPNRVATRAVKVEKEETKPPPRINEAGLLALMEHAGRHVGDEELASALMSAEGLGTAATRADIIQNLKAKGYIDESLKPLVKGIQLIVTLRRLAVARLTSAELTARMELELAEVERGARTAQQFMKDVSHYATDVVEAAKALDWAKVYPDADPIGACPKCSQPVFERPWEYRCGRGCVEMAKDWNGVYLDRLTAGKLLTDGRASEAAAPARRAGATAKDVLGDCPIHKDCRVISTKNAYMCEERLEAFAQGQQNPEGIWIPKIVCKRAITPADVRVFLEKGATGELAGFVSKSGRPFAAKLVRSSTGGFDFAFSHQRG